MPEASEVMAVRRIEGQNHARFLTFSCYRRMALMGSAPVRDVFATSLGEARERLGFRLHAWVAMPDHAHLLVRPRDREQSVARVLQAIKQSVARRVLARWRELDAPILAKVTDERGAARFWQRGGGYDRNVFSDEEIHEKVEYIHANRVRAGLVLRAEEWTWSSAAWWRGVREDGVLVMDRIE